MRLRRSALSFLLLTGLCLGALSPAQAADDTPSSSSGPESVGVPAGGSDGAAADGPVDGSVADAVEAAVGQTADEAEHAAAGGLTVPATTQQAQESLSEVKDLFGPMSRAEAHRKLRSGEGKDATLALRDLSLRLGALPRAERNSAYAAFQRPWNDNTADTSRICGLNICVHYLTPSQAAAHHVPSWAAQPDFAQLVLDTMVHVSRTYRAAGYNYPRSDGNLGGGGQTDIYLRDVGAESKYGYCTVDVNDAGQFVFHPTKPRRSSDLPAFCVLDNDYLNPGFRRRSPEDNLKVTAAHEYFHAVQFAYDYLEDRWFMEATATWAEDQVYDTINDNVQYLSSSQLRRPAISLDTFNGAGGFLHYGDWIFFEYLTERLPTLRGGGPGLPALPVLMLRMWQYADSVHGPDYYSIQAVAAALAEKGVVFRKIFGQYAAANRHPATAYREGRANRYPTAPPRRTIRLKPSHRSASASYKVNHLASATVRFVPKRLPKKRTRLTLKVDMANKRSGSVAVALVYFKTGQITTRMVGLGKAGNGRIRVPFSSRNVARVEIVLANANRSYKRCWTQTAFSCSGVPVKNHVTEKVSAKVS